VDTTLPPLKQLRGRHFLTDLDYTREELEAAFEELEEGTFIREK